LQNNPASIVYIDGFNLYYGALKGTSYKWLNLERFFSMLRPNDNIIKIKYFSAIVPNEPQKSRQESYIKALKTTPKVEIILGKFKKKNVKCLIPRCNYSGSKKFQVYEEKRTDVNIGISLIDDVFTNQCEQFIIVSGDSDLVPAMQKIHVINPQKKIIVYVPANNAIRGAATEIRNTADKNKTLPNRLLPLSQFPSSITDTNGNIIYKPKEW
jgi:uncharacterized LabA/DUF88 family protein